MKKLLLILPLLLLPTTAFAAVTATWIASSTTQGWVFPNRMNGIEQTVISQNFIATSTSLSSRFPYASTTALTVSGALYNVLADGCMQISSNLVTSTGLSCGSSSGGSWATSSNDYYASQFRDWSINSFSALAPTTTRGIFVSATSTIGDGTQIGGLTIYGGSTTTASSTVLGQMGIGTSSPRVRLEIGANGPADEGVYISSNGNSFIDLRADQDNDVAEVGHPYVVFHQDTLGTVADIGLVQTTGQSASGLTMTGATTNAYVIASPNSASLLQIGTNTSIKETFDTTGRIGVGTTTPFWLFQLASNTPALAISDMNAPLDSKHWLVGNYDGAFAIGTSTDLLTSTSTFFVIRPTSGTFGNIFGFGTSSPSTNYKMSVQGGIYAQTSNGTAFFTGQQGGSSYTNSQAVFTAISDNPTGSANFILKGTPGGPGGTLTTSIRFDGAAGFGTTSPFGFHAINPNGVTGPYFVVGSSTATNLIVANGGFVGISTTSPYAMLSVAGSIVAQDFTATSTTATSTIQGVLSVDQGSNTLPGNAWFRVGSSTSNIIVDKLSGNTGIGTSSPFAPLSITGATYIGNNFTATGTINLTAVPTGCVTSTGGLISSNGVSCSTWATTSDDYYQSQFRDWSLTGSPLYLAPTTSRAILVNNASSTITNLQSIYGTTTNATSTSFFATIASTTNTFGAGLTSCNSASNAVTWNNGLFGCNTISSGGSNTDKFATSSAGYGIYPNGGAGVGVVIGTVSGATTTNGILNVTGTTTTTGLNIIGNATTTSGAGIALATGCLSESSQPSGSSCYPWSFSTSTAVAMGTTTISNIPPFNHLKMYFQGSSTSATQVNIQFNNDQTGNYNSNGCQGPTCNGANNTNWVLATLNSGATTGYIETSIDVTNLPGRPKMGTGLSIVNGTNPEIFGFTWSSTTPLITSISINTRGTNNWSLGTFMRVEAY